MGDSNFLLTSKRPLVRGEAPYDNHFFCELRGVGLYGIWLSVPELRDSTDEKRLEIFREILDAI